MTQLLTSLVGSQARKGGALGNPARRENERVILLWWDNWFYLGRAQLKSSSGTCAQLLSFHGRKPQDVYFPTPRFENHNLDIIKSLNEAENSNHTD